MGSGLKLGNNIETKIGSNQKKLSLIFNNLGLQYSITKKGNFIGIGADKKSYNFIKYLQDISKLKPIDGAISEKSAKIILNKYSEKDIENKFIEFSKIHIRVKTKTKLKADLSYSEILKDEIENLDKPGSTQEFVGFYLDKNGNKKYKKIQKGYIPELQNIKGTNYQLRKGETLNKFNEMMKAFGKKYKINSAYRSVAHQKIIYDKQISENKNNGKVITATIPGTSEHHLGLAIDINNHHKSIRKWLKNNAHIYGFTRTYRSVKKDGFNEPWHYRYVGVKLATYLKNHNMGMGEFYTKYSKKLNNN